MEELRQQILATIIVLIAYTLLERQIKPPKDIRAMIPVS